MSTLSTQDQRGATSTFARESDAATIPVILSERSVFVFALIRIFVGYLWFQQLFWKLPPTFPNLHGYILEEAKYTIIPAYSSILQHLFLPNFTLVAIGIWTTELITSLCLLFGVFTRFGALLSTLLALQLYIGLAYAPGEWYWTYGMLVLLGIAVAAIPAGRRLGIDQWLAPRLQAASQHNRLAALLSWFV
jgi:thiosulfate dehydrogenase [quinone] large subunit